MGRATYLRWGFGLAALKFAIDTAIVYGFTGRTWSPLGYVIPSVGLRLGSTGAAPEAMLVLLPLLHKWVG